MRLESVPFMASVKFHETVSLGAHCRHEVSSPGLRAKSRSTAAAEAGVATIKAEERRLRVAREIPRSCRGRPITSKAPALGESRARPRLYRLWIEPSGSAHPLVLGAQFRVMGLRAAAGRWRPMRARPRWRAPL